MPILADKFPEKECTFFASYISLVSKCQIQEHGLSDKFRICEIFLCWKWMFFNVSAISGKL